MSEINWKTKCWVTSIFLVKEGRVLLNWNKNLQIWVPIGGHIEPGENPEEAVRREAKEEVGADIELFGTTLDYDSVKVRRQIIQIEKMPHHNEHINIIFFGKPTNWENKQTTDEDEKLKWFTREELEKEKNNLRKNIYEEALEALQLAEKNSTKKQNPFSIATKAFIIEKGKALLIKRRATDAHCAGVWDLPGGRVSFEENPVDGLKREVKEETGLEVEVDMPFGTKHYTRDDGQTVTGITFLCKLKKQNQKVVLSEEHTEYLWEEVEKAREIVYPGFLNVFDAYRKIKNGELAKTF